MRNLRCRVFSVSQLTHAKEGGGRRPLLILGASDILSWKEPRLVRGLWKLFPHASANDSSPVRRRRIAFARCDGIGRRKDFPHRVSCFSLEFQVAQA